MRQIALCFLLLCVVFSVAELLGPETSRNDEKLHHDEEDDENEGINTNAQVDAEYIKDINKVVDKQLQELKDFIKLRQSGEKKAPSPEDDDDHLEQSSKLLEEIKGLSKKMVNQAGWLDTIVELQGNNLELLKDNPQDILDKLPPLPEEPEPELTPEQQEAKALYEAASAQLNRRTPDVTTSILQIKEAAEKGYKPAQIKLAWSYIYGEGVDMDWDKAKEIFERLAAEGDADAHSGLGFMYAQGIGYPVSQAKALVHYTSGAAGHSTYAQMALAYRYWAGHTVPASCNTALQLYMQLAGKVASSVSLSGGPAIQRVRLLEESDAGALDTDLIEYYQLLAEKGDVQAQVGLGQLHLAGGRGVTLDVSKALRYFQQAAAAGNAAANAFMGKIYLEGGDGIKADNETALKFFKKAAELNNPVGQSGLGLMYLQGRGVPKDTTAAFKYFTMAANQGLAEGQLHLGFMYFGGIGVRRDFKLANKYFSLASQSGHVLAFYHLGQMHAQGLGVMRSCTTAVELFKNVVERGWWDGWGRRAAAAAAAWRAGDPHSAFMQYASLQECGYEVAQTNAAYLLDNGDVTLFPPAERWRRALQLWSRAAAQGYSAARVKLGDYHYYGLGTPVDLEHAAYHYRIASEQQHNAQATFNLGYMHSLGVGLTRDLHLAKRCFDLAADASPDARLPAALALAALTVTTTFNTLQHSPLAVIFLSGDSLFMSNWDLYLITVLLGALGLVVYWRRPQPQLNN